MNGFYVTVHCPDKTRSYTNALKQDLIDLASMFVKKFKYTTKQITPFFKYDKHNEQWLMTFIRTTKKSKFHNKIIALMGGELVDVSSRFDEIKIMSIPYLREQKEKKIPPSNSLSKNA